MLKYFCDRCGVEMSEYAYRTAAIIRPIDNTEEIDDPTEKDYKICDSCKYAFINFMKEVKKKI